LAFEDTVYPFVEKAVQLTHTSLFALIWNAACSAILVLLANISPELVVAPKEVGLNGSPVKR